MTNIETDIKDIKEKQEKCFTNISQIQETANIILAKINSTQHYKEDITMENDKIRQYLPLNSIQNVLHLEDMLKDDQKAFMQVVSDFFYHYHKLNVSLTIYFVIWIFVIL